MSLQMKKSLSGAVTLMVLGIAALLWGVKWLAILIPAALLVYTSVEHSYKGGNRIR